MGYGIKPNIYFYMKEIQLTQEKFALVDDEDFEWLNQWKWYASKIGNTYYARKNSLIDENGKQIKIYMHREIMNTPKGILTDHKDRNGLNNQKHNIRLCTYSQNGANRKSWGVSKYLGVCWDKQNNKWVVRIETDNKSTYLGHFKIEKDAAMAYNEAAKKQHGEFARLNIT